MSAPPLVSVLMNCYNGERYLREALDSVKAQTHPHWELVFWDNQSTDRSAEIMQSYGEPRFKYFRAPVHTDLGVGRALAWPHLRGEYIAVLDADDVWLPHKLDKQLPLFTDPEVGVVFSDTLFFNETREKPLYGARTPPSGAVLDELLSNYYLSLETIVVRRATVMSLRRAFDPDFSFIADFDLVVRLGRVSKLAYCPEILAKWRVHTTSGTWTFPLRFVEEKERWIKKQVTEDPEFGRRWAKPLRRLESKNLRTRAAHEFVSGSRWRAFRMVFSSGLNHRHAWALLALGLLPRPGAWVEYLYRRKAELA